MYLLANYGLTVGNPPHSQLHLSSVLISGLWSLYLCHYRSLLYKNSYPIVLRKSIGIRA
jgi:hypothetical protein